MNIEQSIKTLNTFEKSWEIAEFLRQQGVVGVPESEHSCVIANWLSQIHNVQVHTDQTEIIISHDPDWFDVDTYNVSFAVSDFIEEFDKGQYPELIDNLIAW